MHLISQITNSEYFLFIGDESNITSTILSQKLMTWIRLQMDGLTKTDELVFVLAATNLPWELDAAMLRRLEKRVSFWWVKSYFVSDGIFNFLSESSSLLYIWERERERERERGGEGGREGELVYVCVHEGEWNGLKSSSLFVSLCVCVRERERCFLYYTSPIAITFSCQVH